MQLPHARFRRAPILVGLGLGLFLATGPKDSAADEAKVSATVAADGPTSTPVRARWHPTHAAEIEVHGAVAGFDQFNAGLGGGARVTVPLLDGWPFRRIDNGLAVGVGFDAIRYASYRPTNDERIPTRVVMAYYVPVYAQWSWWSGRVASWFVEAGLLYRHASYLSDCPETLCAERSRVMPVGYLGGRFRLADHFSLVLRAGWPMVTLGASWL